MFYLAESTTFDRIAIRTRSNFSGTATVRLGIYNAADGNPTTVNFDAGTVSATAANTLYAITINQTLTEGWYFTAFCTQGAATTNAFVSNNTVSWTPAGIGRMTATMDNTMYDSYEDGITGAFATVATLAYFTGFASNANVGLRKA